MFLLILLLLQGCPIPQHQNQIQTIHPCSNPNCKCPEHWGHCPCQGICDCGKKNLEVVPQIVQLQDLVLAPVGLTPEQEAKIAIEQVKIKILIDSLKVTPTQTSPKLKTYHLEQRCGPRGCFQVWVED